MSKISIIVPVYNVEKYLSACIESIINQTYQNLEIILVDDGATDNSSQICDAYALKDSRIKVLHEKNAGSAEARNKGLQEATGDFIAFVDSDDLISAGFYQRLLNVLVENNADIVECGYYTFVCAPELTKISRSEKDVAPEIYETEKALELLMKENLKQVVWNKIYRKEVLAEIKFPTGKFIDDEYWTYKVFGNSRKTVKIYDVMYFYRQVKGSIMGRAYSVKRLDGLQALEERIVYMQKNFPALENLAVKIFCLGSLWHYQKITKQSEIDPGMLQRNNITKRVKAYNRLSVLKHWSPKEIFWFQFFLASPKGYAKFRNFINVGI
jgi:glycosyltransferase involved in cell wall biosynthesis